MKIPDEALGALREVLEHSGLSKELESASQEDLEQLASFLLNLTAAAIKTREKLRGVGIEVGPSTFPNDEESPTSQLTFPGLED